jgi:hypothetical protein
LKYGDVLMPSDAEDLNVLPNEVFPKPPVVASAVELVYWPKLVCTLFNSDWSGLNNPVESFLGLIITSSDSSLMSISTTLAAATYLAKFFFVWILRASLAVLGSTKMLSIVKLL